MSFVEAWICSRCGESHSGPAGFSFRAPWPWYATPERERAARCRLTDDECVLFNQDFFVRACLEIPVEGTGNPFIWGVWVSLSKENFERQRVLANSSERTEEPPYFGWLCSRIQAYPDTLLLKTRVHSRSLGMRPVVELEPTDHPLAIEQRTGISSARARELHELMQHKWLHPEWNRSGYYGGAS